LWFDPVEIYVMSNENASSNEYIQILYHGVGESSIQKETSLGGVIFPRAVPDNVGVDVEHLMLVFSKDAQPKMV
jgi:hypothetical protein